MSELVFITVGRHEGGTLRHTLPVDNRRCIFVVIEIAVIEVDERIFVDTKDGLVGLGRVV